MRLRRNRGHVLASKCLQRTFIFTETNTMGPWWTGTFWGQERSPDDLIFWVISSWPEIHQYFQTPKQNISFKNVSFFPFLTGMSGHSGKSERVNVAFAEMVDAATALLHTQGDSKPLLASVSPKRRKAPTKVMGHYNQTQRTHRCSGPESTHMHFTDEICGVWVALCFLGTLGPLI